MTELNMFPTRTQVVRTAFAVFATAAFAGSAFAQYREAPESSGAPTSRWESFRNDVGGLFGSGDGSAPDRRSGGYERGPRGESSARYAQADSGELMVRLDRLENQMRQLTGSIEQLQFRNQQLEQQLKRSQEDIEYRFQELGGRAAAGGPRAPSATAPSQAPVPAAPARPNRRSDAFDPNENPNAAGAPQTLGALPGQGVADRPIYEEETIGAPGGRRAGAPLDLSTLSERAANDPGLAHPGAIAGLPGAPGPSSLPAPPPRTLSGTGAPQQTVMAPSATPRDEFALAQGYIQRKDYALAEEGLRAFLKKHPGDRLAPDAHYWLGESLYQRQRYRDAAESFLTISSRYEKSGKAPDALLRLGQSLAALGEREAACATLGEVTRKYPNAAAGIKQGAEREQKRAKC
jgi:tol-pal system protein YbgF